MRKVHPIYQAGQGRIPR